MGTTLKEKREAALAKQGGQCWFCHKPAREWQIDGHHLHPRSRGGTSCQENIRAVHRACHRAFHEGVEKGAPVWPSETTKKKLEFVGYKDMNGGLGWLDPSGEIISWRLAVREACARGVWPSREEWRQIVAVKRKIQEREIREAGCYKLADAWPIGPVYMP